MVTRWKKWVSLLSLILGLELLAAGAVAGLWGNWILPPQGYGPKDAFQTDYRESAAFRKEIGAVLQQFLEYAAADPTGESWKDLYQGDLNLLYKVACPAINGGVRAVVSNTTDEPWIRPPAGYGFQLRFQQGKATVRLNGQEVDVYGNGVYARDSLWDLPGYSNWQATETEKAVFVTLAVIDRPAALDGSRLYTIYQDLNLVRRLYLIDFAVLAAGITCLALSIVWRKARREARLSLARRTAGVWFEVKVLAVAGTPFLTFRLWSYWIYRLSRYGVILLVIAVAVFCMAYPWVLYLAANDLRHNKKPWRKSLCVSLWGLLRRGFRRLGDPRLTALTGRLWLEVKLLVLVGIPLVLLGYCWTYARYMFRVSAYTLVIAVSLLLALALFTVAFHDLRRNKAPWKNSLCVKLFGWARRTLRRVRSALSMAELKLPLQRRFLLRGLLSGACILVLAILSGVFLARYVDYMYASRQGMLAAFLLPFLLLTPTLWCYHRGWRFLLELGPFLDQLAALRTNAQSAPLELPVDSDLWQAAEDLNGIQQGMRTALDERMRSERMKVELIANVSHDLKTPLTSVVSYAGLLREEEGLPPHVQDYIRILNLKAQRLQVMVQDVFEVSKAASGELFVRSERLDLAKLLRQTLADMDVSIQESSLVFRVSLPAEPVWITADGDRLYRVFQNLIQNALQYSLEGSRVYVTLEVREGVAVAAVKNTSRDELPDRTDFTARFVRGDKSRTDGGSGLGLAIASSFSAACGGSLRVETDADLFTAEVSFPILL